MKNRLATALAALALPALGSAADITLTNSDAFGASSFATKGNWNSDTAPVSGNDYFTGEQFRLRTPADGNSYTFGGDSLTVNSVNGADGGLMYKGTGTSGVLTIENLILDGGWVHHQNGLGDLFQLEGNIQAASDSTLWAKQGNVNVTAPISGSGNLTIPQTDAPTENARYINLLADNSAFTGKLFVNGRLRIISEESLGGNPSAFAADQLTLNGGANGGWLAASNTFAIDDSNRGITLGDLGGRIIVSNPDTNTVANLTVAVPITGLGGLTKGGGGVLTLSGNNDFPGGVVVLAATAGSQLNINSATALGAGALTLSAGANPVTLDNTSGSPIMLASSFGGQNWNNSFTFLGSSSLDMSGLSGVIMGSDMTATISNNNLTIGSLAEDGNVRTLTKLGAGTLTIDGGAFFFGNTVINAGTLALTTVGSISSPTILVATNATLDVSGPGLALGFGQTLAGSGTVVGNVSDGATSTAISPGPNAGTLTIDGGLDLNGGTTLNFDLATTTTPGSGVNDLLIVTGQLNLAGPTTIDISGTPATGTYTLIDYGSLQGSLANLSAPPGFTLNNNTTDGTIELIITHVPDELTWVGDGVLNIWDLGTTTNWVDSSSDPAVFLTGDAVTFDDTGSNLPAVTLAEDLSPSSVTVDASQDYTFTGGGIAAGGLTKSGSGTLILDNTNSYSGPTVIEGGTLQLGDTTSGNFGLAGTIGTGPVTNDAVLAFNRADNLTIASDIDGSGSISNFGASGAVTLSGSIRGGSVIMAGGGSTALSGSNSYSGPTVVQSGTLFVRNASALGTEDGGTVVTNGAQLYIDAGQSFDIPNEPLTLGDGTLRRGGAQATAWGGPVSLVGNATFSVDGGATLSVTNPAGLSGNDVNLTFAGGGNGVGAIAGPIDIGSGSVTVTGGLWNVAPTNDYTGQTFLNGGRLIIPDITALGPAPASPTQDFVSMNGGALGVTNDVTFDDPNRGITIGSAGTFAVDAGATLTISDVLHGSGSLTKWLPGTLELSGSNPFSGNVFVDGNSPSANDGVTRVASPNALANVPATPGTATIIQRNNNSGFSTLQLDGSAGNITLPQEFSLSCRNNDVANIQNIAGNNEISGNIQLFVGGNRVNYQSDAGLLTFSGTNMYLGTLTGGRTYTFLGEGDILVSGPIINSTNGAPISVAKTGAGTTTLAAENTYGNTTTINGGVLAVTGSINSTGGVVVAGGALAGSGTINDDVTVNDSSPSDTIDNLTVNGDFEINGPLAVDVNRTGLLSDRPTVAGTVSAGAGGSIVVNNIGPALEVGDTFALFDGAVANGGALSVSGAGVTWTSNLEVDGTITVASTVVPVPEFDTPFFVNGSLVLSGSGGPADSPFNVLSTTNLAEPLNEWEIFDSGTFDSGGDFALTNAVTDEAMRYYLISIP